MHFLIAGEWEACFRWSTEQVMEVSDCARCAVEFGSRS